MSKNLSFNSIKFHEFSGYEPKDITFMGELFIDQCHSYIEELTIFFETDAAEDWHDVAHGFKGMAAFAGADALYELCLKAQNHYMDNKIRGCPR